MRFRVKTSYVSAEQYKEGKPAPRGVCFCAMLPNVAHFHSVRGVRKVNDGDWIIRNDLGRTFTESDREFKNNYEEAK